MNEPGRMPIQTQAGADLRHSEISVSQNLHHACEPLRASGKKLYARSSESIEQDVDVCLATTFCLVIR